MGMPYRSQAFAPGVDTSGWVVRFATVTSSKVLIVDDEPINVKVARKHLQGAGFSNFVTTCDPLSAVALARQEKPDVILLDVMMPQLDGLSILEHLRQDAQLSQIPVLILTAAGDQKTRLRALDLGAMDFLTKPVDPSELAARVRNTLLLKAQRDQLAVQSERLEQEVRVRTAQLELSRLQAVLCLARAAEFRDDDTGHHVTRVGRCVGIIAREIGFGEKDARMLELAAQLHDVGKIGIPDAILLKPGKHDPAETQVMRRHCEIGSRILEPLHRPRPEYPGTEIEVGKTDETSHSPLLSLAAMIALTHHEKWDGSGYPRGLAGGAIPIEGRLTAVADVFDALSSKRPYKPAFPPEKCVAIMKEGRGVHFDPLLVDAMLKRLTEVQAVIVEYSDAA